MKHTVLITLLLLLTFSCNSQEKKTENTSEITTYYFIRHAEKDRSNPSDRNPHLMPKGIERAERWSVILGNMEFDAVYSTDYNRTKETAKPIADKNGLNLTIYDPNKLDNIEDFLKKTKGKTTLIVGHSNTTPSFVNAILGEKTYKEMDDNNNGNLYIVTITCDTAAHQVLTIN